MLYCRVIMPEITIIDIADNVGFLIYRSFTLGLILEMTTEIMIW